MSLTLPRALRRTILGVVTALLAALITVVDFGGLTTAAHAADPTEPVYHAVSGGSRINVAGVVQSDLTAASSLRVETAPRKVENATAKVDLLNGVAHIEGVQSRNQTKNVFGGIEVSSWARIAGRMATL